ncbi:MAG: ABC transporter permease [Alphaproteobacteria bacterium]|nr:ABC transporter permease [Alphaproteobacteria bacterium]
MSSSIPASGTERRVARLLRRVFRHRGIAIGGTLLAAIVAVSLGASLITAVDPQDIDPVDRLMAPDATHPFGTDNLGRDIFARTLHGGRVSLLVGVSVAVLASTLGTLLGLVSGFLRVADAIVMRAMDGLMAIPTILLAIAMVALTKPSVLNVILAVTLVEVPRVARLVRSVVLTIREQPYVEAAITVGTKLPKLLLRHVLPNALAPLIVQATYIASSAILIESLLSFLGAGTPPEIPTWGNVVAEGRNYFQVASWIIFFPGLFLGLTVLAINLLGDGLRDLLDPQTARRL